MSIVIATSSASYLNSINNQMNALIWPDLRCASLLLLLLLTILLILYSRLTASVFTWVSDRGLKSAVPASVIQLSRRRLRLLQVRRLVAAVPILVIVAFTAPDVFRLVNLQLGAVRGLDRQQQALLVVLTLILILV